MGRSSKTKQVLVEPISRSILIVRGTKVLLDTDLAALYSVTTKALNQAVKRNSTRFPADFMFRLNATEWTKVNRSQSVTGRGKHRDPRFKPNVFSEHGAIMAATILNSPRAVEMSIHVVRAFVQLREIATSSRELSLRLDELEGKLGRKLDSHDQAISGIIKAIRELTSPTRPHGRPIGFVYPEERKP